MLPAPKFVVLLPCLFWIALSDHEQLRTLSVPVEQTNPFASSSGKLFVHSACVDEPLLINFTFPNEHKAAERDSYFVYDVSINESSLVYWPDSPPKRNVTIQVSYGNLTQGYFAEVTCTALGKDSHGILQFDHFWATTVRVHFCECTNDPPRQIRKRRGQSAFVPCLQASDDHQIQWELDRFVLPYMTYALQFGKVELSDFGTYRCLAKKNDSLEAYAATYHLTVIPDKVSNFRVVNITDTSALVIWDRTVKIVNRVGITREVEVDKYITIRWNSFDSQRYIYDPPVSGAATLSNQTEILLTDLKPNNFHKISLFVHVLERISYGIAVRDPSPAPQAYGSYIFFATAPPNETIADPTVIKINLGNSVELRCVPEFVRGLYYVRVFRIDWTRSPLNISPAEYRSLRLVNGGSSFQIDTVLRQDLGTYECLVVFERSRFQIEDDTEDFKRQFVLTLNDEESVENQLPAPTDLQCTNATETALLVKWKSGSTSEHKIRYWIRGAHFEQNGQEVVVKSINEVWLDNLRPETVYGIEVVASNQTKESEPAKIFCQTEWIFDQTQPVAGN